MSVWILCELLLKRTKRSGVRLLSTYRTSQCHIANNSVTLDRSHTKVSLDTDLLTRTKKKSTILTTSLGA